MLKLLPNCFSIGLFLVSFGLLLVFVWLSVVEVATVLCVVLCCDKMLKLVFFSVYSFQVALVFRSCADCLKLSQVLGTTFWLCELCGMVQVFDR